MCIVGKKEREAIKALWTPNTYWLCNYTVRRRYQSDQVYN